VCNTGVSLTPTFTGPTPAFAVDGLYDGLFVMRDDATGSLWNHITGEAMHGPARGQRMQVASQAQTTVAAALAQDPAMALAMSDRPFTRAGATRRYTDPGRRLGANFVRTLGAEDTRRPRMELGLGLWADGQRRYYPMPVLERERHVIDRFDGRDVLVYLDPVTSVPVALFVRATSVAFDGDDIVLDGGRRIVAGVVHDAAGNRVPAERPAQLFTRWYGFALTFPDPEIHAP
jgi:hypothetical protein